MLITLNTRYGGTVSLPIHSITVQHYKSQTWVGPIGDHSDPSVAVTESPSEIAALIQAARDEEWRRQLVCAALRGVTSSADEDDSPEDIATEVLMLTDAIIAADKERCHY